MSPPVEVGDVDLLIREPDGPPEGALILNHGRATDERDLYPLLDEIDPERRLLGVSTGGPLRGIPPGGRHWYVVERVGFPDRQTFEVGFGALTATLDRLLDEREIPWGRTVIGGFSQGTVMSYATALGDGRPTPAAVIALSGFIPVVEGWELDAERASGLPVYIHHGASDPIIGVDHGRRARQLLEAAGAAVTYRESDAGHALPAPVVAELTGFTGAALAERGLRA